MYRKVKITKGSSGWGGPLVLEQNETCNKVLCVTGGGIHPVAATIAEMTGAETVDGFKTTVPDEQVLVAVVDCGGTARCGVYPKKRINTVNLVPVGAVGPLAQYITEDIYVSDVKEDTIAFTDEEVKVEKAVEKHLPEHGTIGFDGRVISMKNGKAYQEIAAKKHGHIVTSEDLIDLIWKDRPALSTKPAFALELKYTGASTTEKLARVREAIKQHGATTHVVASLDDICWITNLRGRDIDYFPLLLSYAIITMDEMKLYVDKQKLTEEMCNNLTATGITFHPYNNIYEDLKHLSSKETILLDPSRINYALRNCIPEGVSVVESENPSVLMKSVKNETELHNIEQAHIKDGVAVTRFMHWLKTHVGISSESPVTELSAADKLEEFRKEQDGYLWQSFEPICASADHAAIVHYSATKDSNVPVTENGLFLTDTGGGYLEGSTDITRTFAFGNVPQNMKEDFTSVLLCNLHLANIVFPYGTTGGSLDVIGRLPLWKRGLDFNHGTGHGVGYLMNIHEEPARFRRYLGNKAPIQDIALEPGMIITDEPGVYIAGSHGIRTENELMICEGETTAYGRFLYFKPITLVPIDLDAVVPEMMTIEDKELLNAYHKRVYETLAPHMKEDERKWLAEYTRAI